jgi:DNA-binding transcriptional regulator LsrR (DeoR family)
MYYLKGEDQSQIAKNLFVSRSMVSRMLTDARRLGLVKIHIERPVNHNTELENLLCQQFGLKTAIVVEQPGGQALLASLGKAAARYLEEELKPGQTLGTSWGTAISATVDELQFETPVPGIRIIQLLGSLGARIKQYHGIAIVNRLVDKLGGEGIYLNAPFLVESAELASVLKESKDIRETFQLGSQADVALLGIGSAEPKVSPYVLAGYLPEKEMQEICDKGAVGDVCGIFMDIYGNPLNSELQERTIGISLEALSNIPLRIGVSGGPHKINPIIGALRGKHVNVLVTDANTAQGVINRTNE